MILPRLTNLKDLINIKNTIINVNIIFFASFFNINKSLTLFCPNKILLTIDFSIIKIIFLYSKSNLRLLHILIYAALSKSQELWQKAYIVSIIVYHISSSYMFLSKVLARAITSSYYFY